MASMQCHKPCEQTNYKLQKSHSADKCHDKHQTGHNGHMISTHSTTHHDKCHQTGGHGYGHGQTTLTNKVKEAVQSASKLLHHDGSHKATAGHCSTGTTTGHIGHAKSKTHKSRQEGKNGHCKSKVKISIKKKNHKENKNSDCSDSDSGTSSSSSSSDSESDCEKPKRKNC